MKKTSSSGDSSASPPRRRRRAVQYALIFIGAVLLVDAFVGEKGLIAMIQARQEQRALEQSLSAARQENARLREEARLLREDARTIEDIARRELGLIKPGEQLFIVKDIGPADER